MLRRGITGSHSTAGSRGDRRISRSGRWRLQPLSCRRDGTLRVDLGLPRIVAARMEVERHRSAIELCLDLIFNFRRRHEHTTKVAGDTASFPAPETNR